MVDYFKRELQVEAELPRHIANVSPLLLETGSFENIRRLKTLPVRLYTEPDSAWWRSERGYGHEHTNAHLLERATILAKAQGWNNLHLIETHNRGYRPNGERHPHSWSIVDPEELMDWVLAD